MADEQVKQVDVPAVPAKAAPPPETAQERADRLRAELAEVEAELPPPADHELVRVEAPHTSFSFGGSYVEAGRYTPVHRGNLAGLFEAAANAGVTLTQKG